MAFQFRLEKALGVKEIEKHLSELEYSKSVDAFEIAAKKLYETLKKKEQIEANYGEKLKAGVHAEILHQYDHHLRTLERLIAEQQLFMNKAKYVMKKKQNAVIEKSVEVKKYATLKDKQFKQYVENMKAEEQKQLDELALLKLGERHGV